MVKALFFLILFGSSTLTIAQLPNDQVDVGQLMGELVITKKNGDNIKQVMLLPPDYWEIALSEGRYAGSSVIGELKAVFDGYLLVGTLDVKVNVMGNFLGNEIDIQLIDGNKSVHKPIPEEELNQDLKRMLEVFKPAMVNMLGKLGEQLQFFIFDNYDVNGDKILAPREKGNFSIVVNESKFAYRTPLGSMVEKKICPTTGEELNGNWDFCPWHGTNLNNKN